jgi:thioredoxin-related protein
MEFIVEQPSFNSGDNITAIYFYARWMDASMYKKCITMINKVEVLYNIKFYAINTDDFKNLCKIYNVTSIPTIVILKKEKEISRINGLALTGAFKKVFADICTSET